MDDKNGNSPNNGAGVSADTVSSEQDKNPMAASRARNRTVMLTPEMTGQVRNMLNKPGDEGGNRPDPLADLLPPMDSQQQSQDRAQGFQPVVGQPSAPSAAPALPPPGRSDMATKTQMFNTDPSSSRSGPAPSFSVTPAIPAVPSHGHYQQPSHHQPMQQQPVQQGYQHPTHVQQHVAPVQQSTVSHVTQDGSSQQVYLQGDRSLIVGFLISYDNDQNGEVFEIRSGRWLMTSRPTDLGNYIFINDETISPLHAIIRATKDGRVQILDQLSEYGTAVIRVGSEEEEEVAGAMVSVGHGDLIRFGERIFLLCLVPPVELA